MASRPRIGLPRQWPNHVKAGVLHAISLAGVVLTYARGRADARNRLRVQFEQATTEIALLREELSIKDGRWERSRSRRRPHYIPTQRMRILQLRAARGWTVEKTARVFLVDLQTLLIWMRRLDEHGERALIQTVEPVNRYPDFVRNLVRQLKRLFPTIGNERLAQILARVGLCLAASTIRRMSLEPTGPSRDEPPAVSNSRRRAVARRPGDVWHVDMTAVPTLGFWVPWFPFSLPQRWPFCWWVAVIVDQASRAFAGFAVFKKMPTSAQLQTFLAKAIREQGFSPRCIVSDKGRQFTCRSYKRWCGRRGIRRRFGFLGEPASLAVVERFIRSMKQECFRPLLVPMTLGGMLGELRCYATWFNDHRPHTTLDGRTPREVFVGRTRRRRRIETRPRWPHQPRGRRPGGGRLALDVSYVAGRKHLPVIELRRAA
jgi:transposase InsO family protein